MAILAKGVSERLVQETEVADRPWLKPKAISLNKYNLLKLDVIVILIFASCRRKFIHRTLYICVSVCVFVCVCVYVCVCMCVCVL